MLTKKLNTLRAKAGNPPYKLIAEKARCSERTIMRMFNGQMEFPKTYYLDGVARALNTTLEELLSDTETSVGNVDELKETVKVLTDEVARLTAENEALNSALKYKDEIIRLKDEIIKMHDRYNELLSSN